MRSSSEPQQLALTPPRAVALSTSLGGRQLSPWSGDSTHTVAEDTKEGVGALVSEAGSTPSENAVVAKTRWAEGAVVASLTLRYCDEFSLIARGILSELMAAFTDADDGVKRKKRRTGAQAGAIAAALVVIDLT
mmetsp:Transcript_34376/g.85702  ORF Transcript_34376/g.85702 Transcript_34376/m.85702 type:complete len:134 (-) Transcript_34376:130-531(-)